MTNRATFMQRDRRRPFPRTTQLPVSRYAQSSRRVPELEATHGALPLVGGNVCTSHPPTLLREAAHLSSLLKPPTPLPPSAGGIFSYS